MTFPKFPELVADPTTNEQNICEWREKTRKQLQEHHCCKDCKVYLESGCPLEKALLEALG